MSPLIVPFRNLHQMRDVYAVSPGGDAAPLEVHIATRSDGEIGAGTLLDPYNGTLDFDKCFRRLTVAPYLEADGKPKKMVVYVHQGDYEGDGRCVVQESPGFAPPSWNGVNWYPPVEDSKGFFLMPNMRVVGVGKVKYKLRSWPTFLINGNLWPFDMCAWATDDGYLSIGGDNTIVENIHIDCNAANIARPSKMKCNAIILFGDNCQILDCSYENAAGYNFAFPGIPIDSIALGSPGIIEVVGHGLTTGDLVSFSGVKMAGGAAGTEDDPAHSELDGLQKYIHVIDADHFSLANVLGEAPLAITIPVSVNGVVSYGGNEAFVFSIFSVAAPKIGYPSIAKDVIGGRILRNKALSFIGDYGVPFSIQAGNAGGGGIIGFNEVIGDQVLTCVTQVIGKGHQIINNYSNGATALVHLDTGYIEELLIKDNTCRNSPRAPISLLPAFPGAGFKGIRIVGNYLENSYSGVEVGSMIVMGVQGAGEYIEDIRVEGNTMRFIGAAPNIINVYATNDVDGLMVVNNIVSPNTAFYSGATVTGLTLKNNVTSDGAVPYGMEDTKISASMHLPALFVTGIANVLQKIPFNTIAYDYSRLQTLCDTGASQFIIPVAGFYKVGVSVFTSQALWTWVVYKDGILFIMLCQDKAMGGSLGFGSASSDIMYFAAGAALEFYASANAGSLAIDGHAFSLPTSSCWIEAVNL